MDTAQVIARAWSDPDFKAQLLNDPKTVLAGHGIDLPVGLNLKIVENTADTIHIVLPATPSKAGELSDGDLQNLAGGKKGGGWNPFHHEPGAPDTWVTPV